MNGQPLHIPSQLDRNQPGAREDLYKTGIHGDSRYNGWEGIDEAKARTSKPTKTPEELIKRTISQLNQRLKVATGKSPHYQAIVDSTNTEKLIGRVLKIVRATKNSKLINEVTEQVRTLREGFKSAKNANN